MAKFFWLILLSFFSPLVINSSEIRLTSFLENYFDSSRFYYEEYNISGKKMIFAYRNTLHEKIFDKAVIFYNHDNVSFQPVLYIASNKLINYSGELLFEGIILTQNFYGWSIRVTERNSSFSLSFYTNKGNNVTDGPVLIWDNAKNSFKLFQADRSQW